MFVYQRVYSRVQGRYHENLWKYHVLGKLNYWQLQLAPHLIRNLDRRRADAQLTPPFTLNSYEFFVDGTSQMSGKEPENKCSVTIRSALERGEDMKSLRIRNTNGVYIQWQCYFIGKMMDLAVLYFQTNPCKCKTAKHVPMINGWHAAIHTKNYSNR